MLYPNVVYCGLLWSTVSTHLKQHIVSFLFRAHNGEEAGLASTLVANPQPTSRVPDVRDCCIHYRTRKSSVLGNESLVLCAHLVGEISRERSEEGRHHYPRTDGKSTKGDSTALERARLRARAHAFFFLRKGLLAAQRITKYKVTIRRQSTGRCQSIISD